MSDLSGTPEKLGLVFRWRPDCHFRPQHKLGSTLGFTNGRFELGIAQLFRQLVESLPVALNLGNLGIS